MGLFEPCTGFSVAGSTKVEILWVYLSLQNKQTKYIYKSRNFMGLFERTTI